jgi:hypothetical protein
VLNQLLSPFVHLVGLYWCLKYGVICIAVAIVIWRRGHNSVAHEFETGRVYISEADEMFGFEDVSTRVVDAEAEKLDVLEKASLSDSEHDAHARRYPEGYWGAGVETWDGGE